MVPERDEEFAERPGNFVDDPRCERELDDAPPGCVQPNEKGFGEDTAAGAVREGGFGHEFLKRIGGGDEGIGMGRKEVEEGDEGGNERRDIARKGGISGGLEKGQETHLDGMRDIQA